MITLPSVCERLVALFLFCGMKMAREVLYKYIPFKYLAMNQLKITSSSSSVFMTLV